MLTRAFPGRDQFVLGNQLRRAAISIGANIAEGCGRNGDGDLQRFLNIALGSANELRYLLEVAVDVEVLSAAEAMQPLRDVDDVCRMLSGLAATARQSRWSTEKEKGTAKGRALSNSRIADSG